MQRTQAQIHREFPATLHDRAPTTRPRLPSPPRRRLGFLRLIYAPVERSRAPPTASAHSPQRRARYSTPRLSDRVSQSVRRAPIHAAATRNAAPPPGQTRADPARGKKAPPYTCAMWRHETDTRPVHLSRQAAPRCANSPKRDRLPRGRTPRRPARRHRVQHKKPRRSAQRDPRTLV